MCGDGGPVLGQWVRAVAPSFRSCDPRQASDLSGASLPIYKTRAVRGPSQRWT